MPTRLDFNELKLKPATLIPPNTLSDREQRLTSVTLSVIAAIPEFAKNLLGGVGQRLGKRSSIECFIEVELEKNRKAAKADNRPDGLIIHSTGRNRWSALVEAKVDNHELNDKQVKKYVDLATKFDLDAVITISNQFVAIPSHHPLNHLQDKRRKVALYHWSWTNIETQATLLLEDNEFKQPEKRLIVEQYLDFLHSEKSGVRSFDSMNSEWGELVKTASSGMPIKADEAVLDSVGCWHQEVRDIVLLLTRKLKQPVQLKLPRAHQQDPIKRINDDAKQLAQTKRLQCEIAVPNAASDISIEAFLTGKSVGISMELEAPTDKKSASARVNWLTRQLKDAKDSPITIIAYGKRKSKNASASLAHIFEYGVEEAFNDTLDFVPEKFTVCWQEDMSRDFSKNRIFIQRLEETVLNFYRIVGENLKAYQPKPPKIEKGSQTSTREREAGA